MDTSIRLFLEESDNIQVHILDDLMRLTSEDMIGHSTYEWRIQLRRVLRRSPHKNDWRIHENSRIGISDTINQYDRL